MKISKILVITFLANIWVQIFADYNDAFTEIFFMRQPNARAEALGRSYVTIDGDNNSYFFNPAGITNINKLDTHFTTSAPLYMAEKGRYYQFGFAYKLQNNIYIGLNNNTFSYGQRTYTTNENAMTGSLKKVTPYLSNYTLSLATSIQNSILVGFNINYFIENYADDPHNTMFFDVGAIYKTNDTYTFSDKDVVSIGASIRNLTNAKIKYYHSDIELPIISRIGLSYTFFPRHASYLSEFLYIMEYQHLFNYEYRNGMHFGIETKLIDIVSLRGGYYYENIDDLGNNNNNVNPLSQFTYGIGLEFSLKKLINYPAKLNIDFTSLPQVSYIKDRDWKNFNSFTFKLSY